MGQPDGWVSDVPGTTVNQQLKLIGNGVVTQQAEYALSLLYPLVGAIATGGRNGDLLRVSWNTGGTTYVPHQRLHRIVD